MPAAAILALLLAAPPEFRVEGGVAPEAAEIAAAAWARTEQLAQADGLRPPTAPRTVRIGATSTLVPGVAAASRPGAVALRPGLPLAGAGAAALRHEVAHQFLFETCPAANSDRLFHEAFSVAASGELEAWSRSEDGRYLPLAKALEDLSGASNLDSAAARRALARLLADVPVEEGRLPPSLARRLGSCEDGARWEALRPEELASDKAPAADALVVLSRHTGEVLQSEGAATLPLPFGSTLKPFMVAGAPGPTPRLAPNHAQPGWRCGEAMPSPMDAATALLRSCNGWFLDWARQEPRVVGFGRWGAVLTSLGLSALPHDASEAIGIRPSLRMSALGIAQAYRLLAEARPDLLDILSRSSREGTLSGLDASRALQGVAAKTGTVLDAEANPRLGWIVAVDRDLVVVMARAGRTPRTFAGALATTLQRAQEPGRESARVQVYGLVDTAEARGRCTGRGFVLTAGGPTPFPDGEAPLLGRAREGPLVCTGGPWMVRLPGGTETRSYAGVFFHDAAPMVASTPGTTRREQNARRGSDLVFRTSRMAYAAGVVTAEDAAATGEGRIALARVADSNGSHSRHLGRPVCDTTHCQAFLGTEVPKREDRRALARPLKADRWLPFSRGGTAPWRETRAEQAVQAALGPGARSLQFGSGRVSFVTSSTDGTERWEERRDLPCEMLRGPLKLQSCPERAEASGGMVVFEGRGQGHGEGLDVEWAKRSGLTAEEIVARAYGR
jgi:hypothetical protein